MDQLEKHVPFINAMINKFKDWPEKQGKWERVLEVITNSNKYRLGTEDIAKIDITIRQIKDLPDNANATPQIKTENVDPQELNQNAVSTSHQTEQPSQTRCGRSLDEIFTRTLQQYFSMLLGPCSADRENQLFALMENALNQQLFQEIKKSIKNFKSTQNQLDNTSSNFENISSVNTLPQPEIVQNENNVSDIVPLPNTPTRQCSVVLKKMKTATTENQSLKRKLVKRRNSCVGELERLSKSLNDSFINKSVTQLLKTDDRGRYKLRKNIGSKK